MRIRAFDLALAGAVVLATAVPVALLGPWWLVLVGLAASVPVLWWRTALLASGAVVGVATTVLALENAFGDRPFLLPWGMFVCTYAYATLASRIWRAVAIALQVSVILATLVIPHENLDTIRSVFTEYVAVYAIGVGVRATRTQRAAEQERALRLDEERARAIERERTRIARDLHDIVTHSVGLMVVQAEAAPLVLRSDPDRAEAAFTSIAETGRDALTQLRASLGTLREGTGREPQPGIGALPQLLEKAGLAAELVERGEAVPVSAEVGIAVYRIVQESLTNTLRHAGARSVRVALNWTPKALIVSVADDGRGAPALREGNGLLGMRERAAACGGSLSLDVDAPGFTVTATLPVLP